MNTRSLSSCSVVDSVLLLVAWLQCRGFCLAMCSVVEPYIRNCSAVTFISTHLSRLFLSGTVVDKPLEADAKAAISHSSLQSPAAARLWLHPFTFTPNTDLSHVFLVIVIFPLILNTERPEKQIRCIYGSLSFVSLP